MSASFSVMRWTDTARLPEILSVVRAAFGGLEPPSGVLKETLADVTARFGREVFFVATSGDTVIGSVFCATKERGFYLTRMAVLPEWRGRGVGRALMQAAENEARRAGLPRLTLRVRKNLPGNRSYFEKAGFVVTGEGQDDGRPPYYVMDGPMLTMPPGDVG